MKTQAIQWEKEISLITNPNIVKAWLKAMLATYFLVMVIMSTIFIGTGEIESLPMVAGIFAVTVAGLFLFGLLVMLIVLGNRYRVRFSVSEEGIVYESIDTKANTLARFTVVAGMLTGRPGAAGAGLLAISQQQVKLKWSPVLQVQNQPNRHTVIIRNQWRDLIHLYCTEENYADVSALIQQYLMSQSIKADQSIESNENIKSPIPATLLHTSLVILSCLALFALGDMTKLDIFVPIFILAFSLATVWLIPLFGWVILPALGFVIIHTILHLGEMREYTLVSTYRYRGYEALDGGDWVLLTLALLGIGYLAFMSWRALKGKLVPVLMQDNQ